MSQRTYKIFVIYKGGIVQWMDKKQLVYSSIIPRKGDILLMDEVGDVEVQKVEIDFRKVQEEGGFAEVFPSEDIYVYVM